jgi:hypothetical protein
MADRCFMLDGPESIRVVNRVQVEKNLFLHWVCRLRFGTGTADAMADFKFL